MNATELLKSDELKSKIISEFDHKGYFLKDEIYPFLEKEGGKIILLFSTPETNSLHSPAETVEIFDNEKELKNWIIKEIEER